MFLNQLCGGKSNFTLELFSFPGRLKKNNFSILCIGLNSYNKVKYIYTYIDINIYNNIYIEGSKGGEPCNVSVTDGSGVQRCWKLMKTTVMNSAV